MEHERCEAEKRIRERERCETSVTPRQWAKLRSLISGALRNGCTSRSVGQLERSRCVSVGEMARAEMSVRHSQPERPKQASCGAIGKASKSVSE